MYIRKKIVVYRKESQTQIMNKTLGTKEGFTVPRKKASVLPNDKLKKLTNVGNYNSVRLCSTNYLDLHLEILAT